MVKLAVPKWFEVLVFINNNRINSIYQISKNVDITYSHTNNIISELEIIKLISKNRSGRTTKITLTNKGRRIAYYCLNLFNFIKKYEDIKDD